MDWCIIPQQKTHSQDIFLVFMHRHSIQSGVWGGPLHGYLNNVEYTIRDAIDYWYWNLSHMEEGVAFRDTCADPHCSNSCPEEIVLLLENAGKWPTGMKVLMAIIILLTAVICLVLKASHVLSYRIYASK